METDAPNQLTPYKLPFTKMHGLGNDFVMVKDVDLEMVLRSALAITGEARSGVVNIDVAAALSRLAQAVCDRRFGIGADGLIVAVRPHGAAGVLEKIVAAYPSYGQCDLAWIYINSDGSSSDMCGNGLRCLAYFARENADKEGESHWPKADKFKVATRAYPVGVVVQQSALGSAGGAIDCSGQSLVRLVRTQLGGPVIKFVAEKLILNDITLSATAVDMGNPHCVIFDCAELELTQYQGCMRGISSGASFAFVGKFPGRLLDLAHQIQGLSLFPQGVNVEFVLPQGRDRAVVYVVERGCGPTLACASGAAAVVAAGVIEERLNRQCCVILPGGELEVTWSSVDNLIELNGPAQIAFSGEFPLGDSFCLSDLSAHSSCESREELPA
ncbi:diaminopimelate epimerase [bacterium]|nr:diaminopimelate epimerase [bacterium]MBP9810161.1 diaminopimelate epimerase [bacterium]